MEEESIWVEKTKIYVLSSWFLLCLAEPNLRRAEMCLKYNLGEVLSPEVGSVTCTNIY